MYSTAGNLGIHQYANVQLQGGIEDASPHRLIQMLYEGLLSRLVSAQLAILRRDHVVRGEQLSRALAILGGLEGALDMERGGELAMNLRDLYRYLTTRVLEATASEDASHLDESIRLVREIKSGWDAIPAQYHEVSAGIA